MKTNVINIMAAAFIGLSLAACSDVDMPTTPPSDKVSNLNYTVDGRDINLTWTLPQATDLIGVRIDKDGSLEASLDGAVTSYLVKHAALNTDIFYTVKARYEDGRMSEGTTVKARIDREASAEPAYLLPGASEDEITDDDEIAALRWFKENYPDGLVITPADLASVDPDEVNEIWVNVDRIGLESGYENLPSALVSADALAALENYVKQGGNLLLTKHATQLVNAIGRIDDQYKPGLFGSGDGVHGDDILTTHAVIGSSENPSYDHTNHPAFANLAVVTDAQTGYGYDSYGMMGPGWREDHNCMWDLNSYGFTPSGDTPNVVVAFEKATNSTVLATWGHVADYCCAGIVEFAPTDDYLGRIIAIGLAAYEWNQNDAPNVYQGNIEQLTKNCIEYLKQ